MSLKQIISSQEDLPFYRNKCVACTKVTIKPQYTSMFHTSKFQMLIDLELSELNESQIQELIIGIERYQSVSELSESFSKIIYMKQITIKTTRHLYIITPMPLVQSLPNYYLSSEISQKEYYLHINQASDIYSILSRKQLKYNMAYNNYSLALFLNESTPFPIIQLTPLLILFSLINMETTEQLVDTEIGNGVETKDKSPNSNGSIQRRRKFKMIEQTLNGTYLIKTNENVGGIKEFNINDFEEHEIIGEGTYGIVKRGINKNTGRVVVVKESKGSYFDNLIKEERILEICKHPNIIQTYGFCCHYKNDQKKGYLLIESCQCDLGYYLTQRKRSGRWLNYKEIQSIFSQIVSASMYLFTTFGIIHRDIKLENFLINETNNSIEVKLCDFGMAIKAVNCMDHFVGTPLFAAPEILNHESYSNKCDLFSLGIILYYLITSNYPFKGSNINELREYYNGNNTMEFNNTDSELNQPIGLCKKLIEINENERISWEDLRNDPFIEAH